MASGPRGVFEHKPAVEGRIKTLLNVDLKEICRREYMAVSGLKAQLQRRILDLLDTSVKNGDVVTFERLRYRVNAHGNSPPPDGGNSYQPDRSTPLSPNHQMANGFGRPPIPQFQAARQFGASCKVHSTVLRRHYSPLMTFQNRHTVHSTISLTETACDRLRADPSLRVMLYCSTTSNITPFSMLDIAFPNQLEVRVNTDEVKSNYKGIKNKPGSTKPADLTDFVRKQPRYNNALSITYALTSKKYAYVVNLVKQSSADELTQRIKTGNVISKDRVIQEMVNKSKDADIVTTSSVMSLKDPISTMRMSLPCRSTVCTHNQCFDASYFLQLQEQAPTWTCPVCNKTISYEALAIDQYVQDILQHTSKDTEQIVIEPEGQWRKVAQSDNREIGSKSQSRAPYDKDSEDEDDDDVVEIQDVRMNKVKTEAQSATPALVQHTPPLSSREASTSAPSIARPNHNSHNKRVEIDLTLSDEDEPPRPAKRQHTSQATSYNTPASLPDVRPHTDMASRPPTLYGNGTGLPHSRSDNTLAPFQPGPLLAPQTGAGQRSSWNLPAFTGWRDGSGSHSGSP